jgi:hypothetical protein
VTGPDGLMVGVEVSAEPLGSGPLITNTDGDGRFSFDIPQDTIVSLRPVPGEGMGLVGESVDWFNIGGGREVRLFVKEAVAFSADLVFPDGFDANNADPWIVPAGKFHPVWNWNRVAPDRVEGTLPAGSYAIDVWASCYSNEVGFICPIYQYYSSASLEIKPGETNNVVVPVMDASRPKIPRDAPNASLVSVGSPDDGGIAVVTGAPGAAAAAATVTLVNLQTGHYTKGASLADGSFQIPFLAPPGAWLEVRQDPTSLSDGGSTGAGTIIRVPVPGEESGAFATMREAFEWGGRNEGDGPIENFGIQDGGQIWISGTLADREWSAGDSIPLNGVIKVYSRDANAIDIPSLGAWGRVYLERVFDPSGKQERSNPVFMSSYLTPTGLPVERRGQNWNRWSTQAVQVGDIEIAGLSLTSPNSLQGTWSANLQIPNDLPDGVYSLVFEPSVDDIKTEDRYFEGAYPQYFDTIFSLGGAALITVGSSAAGRLSFSLAMNDLSDGSRGIVAAQDRDKLGIAARQTTNTSTYVLPMADLETSVPLVYRLEPFAPLVGASNRGWMTTPTVPFAFPSGNLSVTVKQPDGSTENLGSAPFAQPYVQEPINDSASGLDPGNIGRRYFGLTTQTGNYDYTFSQYGKHEISLNGTIDDIEGNTYAGGGTYEVYIARRLDLETGTFASTPFEVNDAFSPTVIVQPGVEADIRIEITHYPESDPAQRVSHVISGRSNRFGYFHPESGDAFVFPSHGEYRVDITASHRDEAGILWMGSESWASVVETPNSPIIAHGMRAKDCGNSRQQWLVVTAGNICGTHMPFPYHTGDIAWSMDTDVDPYFTALFPAITVQDTQGQLEDLLRERFGPNRGYWFGDIEGVISIGEIPLLTHSAKNIPGPLLLDDEGTHKSYFYSGAARPGTRVRDMVSEGENQESYWRFEGRYYDQNGTGVNGDQPNDFKFQFGGAVYRAPENDFYYYGAYGSLWVGLRKDDPTGTRVMPPFQGNAGGPSGGPIMTLQGQDIDMFFHPTGTRPGSILEVGDFAVISGQIAPTLPSQVSIAITSPSNQVTEFNGRANKVGYYFDPDARVRVKEPGVWQVSVYIWHDGQTSAGPTLAPFPSGGVLGSDGGTFKFYVVESGSQPLTVEEPASLWVQPANEVLNFTALAPDGWTDVVLYQTTVMPGFILDDGPMGGLTYPYNATALHESFPNLDLADREGRYGADTVTLSLLLSGKNADGKPAFRARQVLLQGEHLMIPQQGRSDKVFNSGFE